jgi:transposase InsO family protein
MCDEERKMDDLFGPKDHAEAVARFRAQVIGHLTHADLGWGELGSALEELSHKRFRAPGSDVCRTYGTSTLERWYYAYKNGGLEALRPKVRSDRGHGRALTDEMRELICDIRRDHPTASVPLILDTLVRQGRLGQDTVSPSTVRRMLRRRGLTRQTGLDAKHSAQRLRWQAAHPFALWHGDVCHGPALRIDGVSRPVRIHALLDDASRFVVAIEAHHTEREQDMLELFADTLRRHPAPERLYLDNGSTYSGKLLSTICERLDIGLVHATPYSPEARGKMERFWRTLRERCLNHTGKLDSLTALNARLWSFVDQDYHRRPHSGLMGKTPVEVFQNDRPDGLLPCGEDALRQAFVARTTRRVKKDSTLSHDGRLFEVDQRFLSGRTVDVCFSVLDHTPKPWVEHDGQRFELFLVDVTQNARRRRTPADTQPSKTDFDPTGAMLDEALGRRPSAAQDTQDDR